MIDLKDYAATLNQKPVAVFGLGLSGLSAIRALVAAGVRVVAWDDQDSRRTDAQKTGAEIQDLERADFSAFAVLILAPGIPLHFPKPHPVVLRAREAGIEIIGDIELLHRSNHGRKTIGITGTNGKSTTTALTGHVLKRCGVDTVIAGNIGHAALEIDLPQREESAIVLELSSYQLDLCPTFAPDIAIHLNLTPDHIDRHGDLAGYVDAKMRIFKGKGAAIIGIDDGPSLQMMERVQKAGERDVFLISTTMRLTGGVFVENGIIFDAMNGPAVEIGSLAALSNLPGVHNHQNITAAYVAARLMGLNPESILKAMETYPGLPHRLYMVRHINGVGYINDSKATNANAAGKALACYKNIYWIVGGKPKAGGLDGLEPYMDRIIQAYVIGDATDDFSLWLKNHGVAFTRSETLDRAVADAHKLAQKNRGQPGGAGVVLLSPACASFDQFQSFEHRGRVFTDLVLALPDEKEVAAG
ncbi:MAG: UDP-N-acetylmuramoyl-L-alanine--D-glutamate ligase [Micavibrio sp.]